MVERVSKKGGTEMKYNEKFNLQQLLSDCKGLIDELSRKVSVMERIVNESGTTITFERTWKNARLDPPKECGRYWCLVEEQNDLGKSHFQWNCSYHEIEKRWSDNHENYNVIYWTELAPMPF
jgi:hypothetical protein